MQDSWQEEAGAPHNWRRWSLGNSRRKVSDDGWQQMAMKRSAVSHTVDDVSRCVSITSVSIACLLASRCIQGTHGRYRMLPSNPGGLHNHRSDAIPGIPQHRARVFVPRIKQADPNGDFWGGNPRGR